MIIINKVLEDIKRKEYLRDKQAQQVSKKQSEDFKIMNNSLILFKELVYILKHQQESITHMYHNNSLRGH